MDYGRKRYRSPFGDTTFTKVFVGGLAWETPAEELRTYFEQFGHILEAVIITDKITGKSKGYGFVSSKIFVVHFSFNRNLPLARVNYDTQEFSPSHMRDDKFVGSEPLKTTSIECSPSKP